MYYIEKTHVNVVGLSNKLRLNHVVNNTLQQ